MTAATERRGYISRKGSAVTHAGTFFVQTLVIHRPDCIQAAITGTTAGNLAETAATERRDYIAGKPVALRKIAP